MAALWQLPGAPLPNPVSAPAPGTQSKSIRDAQADRARDADKEAQVQQDARGVAVLTVAPSGAPILMRPAGHDTRPARNPRTWWFTRKETEFNNHAEIGAHGELVAGANPNPGHMNPGVSQHRNTFRVPPAPWDTAYFVAPAGSTEDR